MLGNPRSSRSTGLPTSGRQPKKNQRLQPVFLPCGNPAQTLFDRTRAESPTLDTFLFSRAPRCEISARAQEQPWVLCPQRLKLDSRSFRTCPPLLKKNVLVGMSTEPIEE